MKSRTFGWAVLFGALLCVFGGAVAADAEPTEIVLNGEYVWGSGSGQPIKAVFVETGENQYDVSFYFTFRERDRVYTGTARGEMGSGKLSGQVKNGSRVRNFTFEGQFKDGRFSGSHTETTAGNERDTGTIWLE